MFLGSKHGIYDCMIRDGFLHHSHFFFLILLQQCRKYDGGECMILVDGYFIEVTICTVCGVLWYLLQRKSLKKLQSRPIEAWQVTDSSICRDETKVCNLPDLVGPRIQVNDEPK